MDRTNRTEGVMNMTCQAEVVIGRTSPTEDVMNRTGDTEGVMDRTNLTEGVKRPKGLHGARSQHSHWVPLVPTLSWEPYLAHYNTNLLHL